MIKKIRHTGIVVRDLEKAVRFYEGLGFKLWKRDMEAGAFTETVVGLKDVNVETVKFKSPCGGLIELLQYHSHPVDAVIQKQPSNQPGCSHIAITVYDIDKTLNYIKQNGGSVVNPPETSPHGKVRVAYCHDPEGILLEVVEEL